MAVCQLCPHGPALGENSRPSLPMDTEMMQISDYLESNDVELNVEDFSGDESVPEMGEAKESKFVDTRNAKCTRKQNLVCAKCSCKNHAGNQSIFFHFSGRAEGKNDAKDNGQICRLSLLWRQYERIIGL